MLCAQGGRFLFEARPDVFPEGYLTDCELELWGFYYQELNDKHRSK
jgi:hypothetical protein